MSGWYPGGRRHGRGASIQRVHLPPDFNAAARARAVAEREIEEAEIEVDACIDCGAPVDPPGDQCDEHAIAKYQAGSDTLPWEESW